MNHTTNQKQTIADQKQTIADQKQTIADQKQTIAAQKQTIADQKQTIADQSQVVFDAKEFIERVVKLMSNAIELRDPYTKGHSDVVAQITTQIAQNLFGDIFPNIDSVSHSALVHDIGKIAIPETVLNKPTRNVINRGRI